MPLSFVSFGTIQPKKIDVSAAPTSNRMLAANHSNMSKIVSSASAGMKLSDTRGEAMDFFKQQSAYQYKWMWKMIIKRMLNYHSLLAEANNDQNTKERVDAFRNSPESAEKFMKAFDYKDSKFQTVCHSDLHSAQIMFARNEDGEAF